MLKGDLHTFALCGFNWSITQTHTMWRSMTDGQVRGQTHTTLDQAGGEKECWHAFNASCRNQIGGKVGRLACERRGAWFRSEWRKSPWSAGGGAFLQCFSESERFPCPDRSALKRHREFLWMNGATWLAGWGGLEKKAVWWAEVSGTDGVLRELKPVRKRIQGWFACRMEQKR